MTTSSLYNKFNFSEDGNFIYMKNNENEMQYKIGPTKKNKEKPVDMWVGVHLDKLQIIRLSMPCGLKQRILLSVACPQHDYNQTNISLHEQLKSLICKRNCNRVFSIVSNSEMSFFFFFFFLDTCLICSFNLSPLNVTSFVQHSHLPFNELHDSFCFFALLHYVVSPRICMDSSS